VPNYSYNQQRGALTGRHSTDGGTIVSIVGQFVFVIAGCVSIHKKGFSSVLEKQVKLIFCHKGIHKVPESYNRVISETTNVTRLAGEGSDEMEIMHLDLTLIVQLISALLVFLLPIGFIIYFVWTKNCVWQ
jgi:hypothetical protein